MSILITGAAGFIGFHTALSLIKKKKKLSESIIWIIIITLDLKKIGLKF